MVQLFTVPSQVAKQNHLKNHQIKKNKLSLLILRVQRPAENLCILFFSYRKDNPVLDDAV